MGRARPIKTLCFTRVEWLKFDDYVPARITKKSLGFVSFLKLKKNQKENKKKLIEKRKEKKKNGII